MGGPINIKGVTSSLTRHYGGGDLDTKKRFLDSKGYSDAFKKAFKTNDLNKIKQRFREAGLKTNRFDTSQKIKEKDFLRDIKLAAKTGIIKDSEMAKNQFRREQIKENHDLTFKEKRAFNILSTNTKRGLIWGEKDKKLSYGAKMAAEEQKIRDQNLRKAGDVGIEGFETMEKEGDSTLWERYKALNALRHKNKDAVEKLKEISSQINLIRLRAKSDPSVLRNYGIPEVTKDKSGGAWKPKTLHGREGVKAEDNKEKDKPKDGKNPDKETPKDKPSSSQGSVAIAHSGGGSASLAGIPESSKREAPVVPFSIVKGFRDKTKTLFETGAKDIQSSEKIVNDVEPQEWSQEQEYGFIDQEEGNVKLG